MANLRITVPTEQLADISREDYDRNETLCFALTHLIQVIGEAAQRSHV